VPASVPPRRSLHAVVAIAVAAAVAVVLAFILVVPLLNAASEITDGLVHAYADYWDGVRHQFQHAQQGGAQP
jgi:hypothetical protein